MEAKELSEEYIDLESYISERERNEVIVVQSENTQNISKGDIPWESLINFQSNIDHNIPSQSQINTSYKYGSDIDFSHIHTNPYDTVITNCKNTWIVFLIIIFGLPLYSLTVVSHPIENTIKKTRKIVVICLCSLFYILFWLHFILWFLHPDKTTTYKDFILIVCLYIICSLNESILKTTKIVKEETEIENILEKKTISCTFERVTDKKLQGSIGSQKSIQDGSITLNHLLDYILSQRTSNKNFIRFRVFNLSLGLILNVIFEIVKWKLTTGPVNTIVILYAILSFIVRTALVNFVLFYAGDAILHLYNRLSQCRIFASLTSYSASHNIQQPFLHLNKPQDINSWQYLRTSLIHYFQSPDGHINTIIATFILTAIPILLWSIYLLLTKSKDVYFTIVCCSIAFIFCSYLVLMSSIQIKIRDTMDNVSVLTKTEMNLLYLNSIGDTINRTRIIKYIKSLSKIIKEGKDTNVILNIWGMNINRAFITFLFGGLVSILSVVISRLG